MIGARVVATAAVALSAALAIVRVTTAPPPSVRLYHDNPEHLWNRLHAALFVRAAADGREYGGDRVDPLLWSNSKYLLHGPAHDRAASLLKEFADTRGDTLIADPLKRAILQRDLWSVFDWLEVDRDNVAEKSAGAMRLRGPLATAIARLALTPEQIALRRSPTPIASTRTCSPGRRPVRDAARRSAIRDRPGASQADLQGLPRSAGRLLSQQFRAVPIDERAQRRRCAKALGDRTR